MSNAITNFTPINSAVPAFLAGESNTDNDITAHASLSFPVISIKGKVFAIVRDGDRKIIPNPKDPQSPASRLEVVIIKVNPNKSKAYYDVAFKDGEEIKPRCFSNDGKTPDASVEHPCSKSCANCPFNAFGSRKNPDGSMGKGKACSDSVRIAVAAADNIADPFLIRVPATSMKALGEFGRFAANRKLPYQALITQISFDPTVPTPRLMFKALGYVSEATYHEAIAEASTEVVRAIIGEVAVDTEADQLAAAELADAKHDTPAEVSPSKMTEAEAEHAIEKGAEAPAVQAATTVPEAPASDEAPTADSLIDAFSNLEDFDA